MKRILLVALAELVLFFLCAAQEFHFVMLALQCIGNKENLWGYFLPFLVSSANAIYLFFTYHSFLNPRHKKGLKRLLIVNGAIMGALGLASASLVVIYVATGIYPSFCFGGVSTLFPLDGFILAIVEFLMGGFTIGFALLRADKLEWDEPKDEHGPAYRWIVQRILAGLQTFIAMLLLGDFLFGMYSVKELSGDVGLIIPTVILLILPPVELFLQRLIVDKLDPLKKHFYMMRVLPCLLLVGLICSVWLYFGLMNNPTGPATSLVQFLPIDFMTSVSIGPIVFILMNLVPPLCYFFDYFRAKKGEGENRG